VSEEITRLYFEQLREAEEDAEKEKYAYYQAECEWLASQYRKLIDRLGQPAVDALMSGEQIPSGYYEELHPIEDWHEDDGNVLWWSLPVCEPPYCGTPNDTDFRADNGEGYFTHFSHIVRNSVIGEWNKRLDKPQSQQKEE
jgi:hypothetical protein